MRDVSPRTANEGRPPGSRGSGRSVLALVGPDVPPGLDGVFAVIDADPAVEEIYISALVGAFGRGGPADTLTPDDAEKYVAGVLGGIIWAAAPATPAVVIALWMQRQVLIGSIHGGRAYMCSSNSVLEVPLAGATFGGTPDVLLGRAAIGPADYLVLLPPEIAQHILPGELLRTVQGSSSIEEAASALVGLAGRRGGRLSSALVMQFLMPGVTTLEPPESIEPPVSTATPAPAWVDETPAPVMPAAEATPAAMLERAVEPDPVEESEPESPVESESEPVESEPLPPSARVPRPPPIIPARPVPAAPAAEAAPPRRGRSVPAVAVIAAVCGVAVWLVFGVIFLSPLFRHSGTHSAARPSATRPPAPHISARPAAPLALHSAQHGGAAVLLSWQPAHGATGYLVSVRGQQYRTAAPHLLLRGRLRPDRVDRWRVRAVSGSAVGAASAWASFRLVPVAETIWRFPSIARRADQVLLTLINPGKSASTASVTQTGRGQSTVKVVRVSAGGGLEVPLPLAAGGEARNPIQVKASRPILATRLITTGSTVKSSYGFPGP